MELVIRFLTKNLHITVLYTEFPNLKKNHSFTRKIWRYDQVNYELLRNKAAAIDWDDLRANDIDSYAANLNSTMTSLASEYIPNKIGKIKTAERSVQYSTCIYVNAKEPIEKLVEQTRTLRW